MAGLAADRDTGRAPWCQLRRRCLPRPAADDIAFMRLDQRFNMLIATAA
jgi:hypothetical protein